MSLIFLRCSHRFKSFIGMGGTLHMQNAYMYEILVDLKILAQFVLSQVTELRDGRLFMFEDEAA